MPESPIHKAEQQELRATKMSRANDRNNSDETASSSPRNSGSQLLERRRIRNANSSTSSYPDGDFNLTQLNIPNGLAARKNSPLTQPVRYVHSIERDSAHIVTLCLRCIVTRRLLRDGHAVRAEEMLRQAEWLASDAGTGHRFDDSNRQEDGSSSSHGNDSNNQNLALRLAGLADEFSATRAGELAAVRAREMRLPSASGRENFNQCLEHHLANFDSIRRRVALLLVLCSELAIRAVLQCNLIALSLVVGCCSEQLRKQIAPIVIVRGWGTIIGATEQVRSIRLANCCLLTTLILIGCFTVVNRCTK